MCCRRCILRCAFGKHYTVFYHKGKSYFSSLLCGTISAIFWMIILYYLIKSMATVIDRDYTVREEYLPISFQDQSFTIGEFFKTTEMVIMFQK